MSDAYRTEHLTVGNHAYTLEFIREDDPPSRPWDDTDGWVTTIVETRDPRDSRYSEIGTIETATYMRKQAGAVIGVDRTVTGVAVRNAWDRGHSEAAIVRWLRLQGCTGVQVFDRVHEGELALRVGTNVEHDEIQHYGPEYGDPRVRRNQCDGFVFIPPGVAEANLAPSEEWPIEGFVADEVAQVNAAINGDVFFYVLTHDATGNVVDSVGGYVGDDREAGYVRQTARESAQYASEQLDWLDAEARWRRAVELWLLTENRYARRRLLHELAQAVIEFDTAVGQNNHHKEYLAALGMRLAAQALAEWVEQKEI